MTSRLTKLLVIASVFAAAVPVLAADDARNKAIKKDRERIAGTWRIVELVINGNPAKKEDARKLTVKNKPDGTWSLRSEGLEITKGTSTLDPSQTPKTIDFTPTTGDAKGMLHKGIYELGDDVRKLCFASSGNDRPADFSSSPGSGHILVKFQRVK